MNNNKVINLFAHQKEMVKAADEHTLGVLVSPTGSGKTLTQAEIAAQEINKGGFRVILVKTPRILLSNQVAEEYNNYFFGNHNLEREIDYNSILVHSGKSPAEREDSEDDNSDMTDEEWADISNQLSNAYSHRGSIRELVEDAKANDIPFVIFTTYTTLTLKQLSQSGDTLIALSLISMTKAIISSVKTSLLFLSFIPRLVSIFLPQRCE